MTFRSKPMNNLWASVVRNVADEAIFAREHGLCPCLGILKECSLSVSSPFSLTPDTPAPCSECLVLRRHRGWAPVVCNDCMFFACMTAHAHVSSGRCQPQGMSDLQLKAHRFPCGLCIDFTQYRETKSNRSFFCIHSWLSHKSLLYYHGWVAFFSLNYPLKHFLCLLIKLLTLASIWYLLVNIMHSETFKSGFKFYMLLIVCRPVKLSCAKELCNKN